MAGVEETGGSGHHGTGPCRPPLQLIHREFTLACQAQGVVVALHQMEGKQAVTEARTLSPRPLLREVIGTPLPVLGLAQDWPEAEPARREQPAQAASAGSMPTGPAGNSDHNVNSFL